MNRKAVIFGIKGYKLTIKEKKFFFKTKPWGIILFSRNIKDITQLKELITSIKNIFKSKHYPILIDQEGGKVSRLNSILDLSIFSQSFFLKLYKKDKKLFKALYQNYINVTCDILNTVGVNINTSPVLDVKRKITHSIIGTRSFSTNVSEIIKLGNLYIDHYRKKKIATVIKHIPGHGLSKFDTHFKKPIINAKRKELIKKDFKPFLKCKSLFAMTCHAIYSKYDSVHTATHSKIIIKNVIRNHIRFKGILISDDISMKSLSYRLEENAVRAIKAGCNLVLHCNGNIKEMSKLSKVIPKIDIFTQKKTEQFFKFLG